MYLRRIKIAMRTELKLVKSYLGQQRKDFRLHEALASKTSVSSGLAYLPSMETRRKITSEDCTEPTCEAPVSYTNVRGNFGKTFKIKGSQVFAVVANPSPRTRMDWKLNMQFDHNLICLSPGGHDDQHNIYGSTELKLNNDTKC